MAAMLEARPSNSAAVILSRKAIPNMSRRAFHTFEKRGVDCDRALSFTYKDKQTSKNPWLGTRLATGSIFDVAPPRHQDMSMPFDTGNFAFEAHQFRNLSLTQRNKLVTSNENDNLYDKLLEAAFTGPGCLLLHWPVE